MTDDGRAALLAVQDAHAFDPAPRHSSLWLHHVPFDELTGRPTCEARLDKAIRRGERVALVGASGSGKSSVSSYVLGPLVEGLAPLPIPVSLADPAVAVDPLAFAEHVVQTTFQYVQRTMPEGRGESDRATREQSQRLSKFSVMPQWLGAGVALTAELEAVETSLRSRPRHEAVEIARELLDIIAGHGAAPVLVLDDTDTWLSGLVGPESTALRAGFFGRVVRLLAEDLSYAAVLAVHANYLRTPEYALAAGFLDTTVRIPTVSTAAGIGEILGRRITEALEQETESSSLVTPEALDLLFAHYRKRGRPSDLRRRVLFVAHTALARACDDDAEAIDVRHVEQAIAECAPEEGLPHR